MSKNPAQIEPGRTATVNTAVYTGNIAGTVGSGSLDVFATPMMTALMEKAACACLEDCLSSEQTSVGVQINVTHTAASPIGEVITAVAVIEKVSGRKIEFTVSARDSKQEIGNGSHTRVLVNPEAFMGKLQR